MKTLVYDIEYSRHKSNTFGGKYEVNVASFERYGYILSISYKWLNEAKTHVLALPDFAGYKKDKENDKELVQVLHKLFSESDSRIAHNGKHFDEKVANTRFLYHRLLPPEPKPIIDTLSIARSKFAFPSNSLDDLAHYLGLEGKLETAGKRLWDKCEQGDEKAWVLMKKYNKQDVILLENVYNLLAPWATTLPNATVYCDEGLEKPACTRPGCTVNRVQRRGYSYGRMGRRRNYNCACGKWFTFGPLEKLTFSV